MILAYPPSVNSYWRHNRGRVHISHEGEVYRELVAIACLEQKVERFTKDDRLAVHIVTHAPDKRRRDLDNTLKALLDALQAAGVYPDDSQIDALTVKRGTLDGECGWVKVLIVPNTQEP